MMKSTQLPTDSLYKMLTIGGLVLIISGSLFGWKAIDENKLANLVNEGHGGRSIFVLAP